MSTAQETGTVFFFTESEMFIEPEISQRYGYIFFSSDNRYAFFLASLQVASSLASTNNGQLPTDNRLVSTNDRILRTDRRESGITVFSDNQLVSTVQTISSYHQTIDSYNRTVSTDSRLESADNRLLSPDKVSYLQALGSYLQTIDTHI